MRKVGFQPGADSIELSPEQEGEIEISLKPDDARQSPAAVRKALQGVELRRDTSAATDSVGRGELLALPLGDDPLRIISQTAGMSLNPTEEGATVVNVGGARSENSNVFYDGLSPSIRAAARVGPANPGGTGSGKDQGRLREGPIREAKRAGLVGTVVTRRGGEQYHGSRFGYFRNDKLNSRNFFDRDRPQDNRAQFGGVWEGLFASPAFTRAVTARSSSQPSSIFANRWEPPGSPASPPRWNTEGIIRSPPERAEFR